MLRQKIKLGAATIFTAVALAGAPVLADQPANPGNDNQTDEGKVTICHRTDSVKNPYEKITVDQSAVDGEGQNDHSQHTGPVATSEAVAQSLKDNHQNWGDIIPNILNWNTEGQAVFNNGCQFGGQGGGTTENNNQNRVATAGGQGAATQAPAVAPQGGVAAGAGGAKTTSAAAAVGLLGSIGTVASGLVLAARKF